MLATLVMLYSLGPEAAIERAADIVGRPDIVPALLEVCRRESRCQAIGVHAVDAHHRASSYVGQVRLGHLDASCQERGDLWRWGTRGMMGLNAADHWEYMPACYQPEVFDVPIVSALVAARKYLRRCDGERQRSWCPKKVRG
jgi:hypothetical protein